MKYYNSDNINKLEFIIPLILLALVLLALLGDQELLNKLVFYAVCLITFCFWIPRTFYFLNINFNKWKTSVYWLIIFGLISITKNYLGIITLFPLIGLMYLQIMRLFHIYMTGLEPTFSAHWSTENSSDKFANRKVDDSDLGFMFVYGILLLIIIFTLGIGRNLS